MEIKVSSTKRAISAIADIDMGGDLDASVRIYGKECVHQYFLKGAIIAIQAPGRRILDETGDKSLASKAMKEYDLKTGRGIRTVSKGEAMGVLMPMFLEMDLDAIQMGNLMLWYVQNPGADETAIHAAGKMFKTGLEMASTISETETETK
jgi:hypothetical protein